MNRRSFFIHGSRFAGALLAATPVRARAQTRHKRLRFGVIAELANEPDRMLRVYSDLLAQLSLKLGSRGIEVAPLIITRDLAELARLLALGEVDMVCETVFVTLDLQQERLVSLTPRLAIVRRDQREYHSVFFTNRSGAIAKLSDLRGRTLVLQASRSTSAYAVPRAELARNGIRLFPAGQPKAPRNAAFYVFAGAELNQAIWVLKGKGDAGAFNEGDWDRLPEKVRAGLVIFHETQPLLRGLVSFRKDVDPTIRRASEEALLDLHREEAGQRALRQADGITRFETLTGRDGDGLALWRRALRSASGQ
jgi:phosphonate transport system substrate-binding protein